jgi:hypothetical protein
MVFFCSAQCSSPSRNQRELLNSPYLVLYDLAVEVSSMRLPPGAVTNRIYGPGIAADGLNGGIGA